MSQVLSPAKHAENALAESESDAGATPKPCVRPEWFHHSVAWNAVRSLGVRQSHMPTAMLGVKKEVLPNARGNAVASAAGVSSGTAVCAIHATARNACVARVSRNCQIDTDAKCMRSSNAVKAMAARQCRVQKRTKEGSNPQGMSLTKRLEAEMATRLKIQPRLKHRGKDKPLAASRRPSVTDLLPLHQSPMNEIPNWPACKTSNRNRHRGSHKLLGPAGRGFLGPLDFLGSLAFVGSGFLGSGAQLPQVP